MVAVRLARIVALVFVPVALGLMSGACQREAGTSGPSVSGESHFLMPCDRTGECGAGLECLCGLCTVACEADDGCAAIEPGLRCVEPSTCAGGARVCLQACTTDADCITDRPDDLRCLEGACVAAVGVGVNCVGGDCPVRALVDNPYCGADCPALADLSRGCLGSHTEQDCVFCGETYVRIGGNDGATLYYHPTGEVAAVNVVEGERICDDAWYGLDLSTCVDRGEQRRVPCEGGGEPPNGLPLLSLAVSWGWGPCDPAPLLPDVPRRLGACAYTLGVRAPRTLVLTDDLGTLEFDLTPVEFRSVESVARSPGFQAILDRTEPCPGHLEGSETLTLQREGEAPASVANFTGCEPEAAVTAVVDALRALLEKYMVCPAPTPPGVVPLPVRPLCFVCEDCPRTDCQGVIVSRGATSYCVGPDSPRFTCPESRPNRSLLNGTAICTAEPGPLDERTTRQVAREALQTGLIQSQASIVHLAVPAVATHFPGLAGGSRVEGTAVVSEPGTPWFSGDEGPISCGTSFSHLEIAPASEGVGFFVTAWDDVVECGQPQPALAYEVTSPATFTLPDPPGLYPVVLGQPFGTTAGPTLLVEQDVACPAQSPPLDTCYTGALFAECGGALPPAIFCTAEDRPCLWFTGGCPAAGYTRPVECSPVNTECPEPGTGWGPAPWDRARDMVLSLSVDPAFEAPAAPSVVCTCDTPPCLGAQHGFCNDALAERYFFRTPEATEPDAPRNGLVVAHLFADGAGLGLTPDWHLTLEADVERARARMCLFQGRDAGNGGPPACARTGEVVFDRVVRTRGDVQSLHGRALGSFGEPGTSGALVIDARF